MTNNTVLTCHCGTTKELSYKTSNMGDVMNEGWGVNATFDGKLLKVCPACYKKLVFHAKQIYDLTGNPYVSLSHLLKEA